MVEIRVMKPEEAQAVRKLGRKTFEWFEALWVPKPKKCFVAVEGDDILGAVIYKYFKTVNKTIGYVDYIFVDKKGYGKGIGIGTRLVDACFKAMDQDGCDGYSAIVRDDNVGSWKMFINKGLSRYGIDDLFRRFGLKDTVRLSFQSPLFVATGMEFYLAMKSEKPEVNKDSTRRQLINLFLYTIIFLLPILIRGLEYAFYVIGAILVILSIRVVFGYIGTRLSNEKWSFRVNDGGFFIPTMASIFGGAYYISGNWYPSEYRRDQEFRSALGKTALLQWISVFLLVLIGRTSLANIEFVDAVVTLGRILLAISVIPFYPMASFGGERIFNWNKWVYGIVVLITILEILL